MSIQTNIANFWTFDLSGINWTYNNYYYLGGWLKWSPADDDGGGPDIVDESWGFGSILASEDGESLRIRHLASDVVDESMYCQMSSGGAASSLQPVDDGPYDIPESATEVWIQWLVEMRLLQYLSSPFWVMMVKPYLYTPGGGGWWTGGQNVQLDDATDYTHIDTGCFAALLDPPNPAFSQMFEALIADLYFLDFGSTAMLTAERRRLITHAPHLALNDPSKVAGYWPGHGTLIPAAGTLGNLAINSGSTVYDADKPNLIRTADGPRLSRLPQAVDVVRGRPPELRSRSIEL